ncbi:MAG TPA: secondary thiamine-phosphate synthase enzyme YjbQ [Bacteroidota bacterium]|nr:secondary thiamine-phosphate synthase enzyme YjbQ [Bacteroidota bacterium]
MHTSAGMISLHTKGFADTQNITDKVQALIRENPSVAGIVTLFIPGSTAGITTIEFEPGVVSDFRKALERLIPQNIQYEHDTRWGDGNGFAHVRASFIGPSLTVPFSERSLLLGTWQQIVVVDFDNRPRDREIIVQILGE